MSSGCDHRNKINNQTNEVIGTIESSNKDVDIVSDFFVQLNQKKNQVNSLGCSN